jgi:antitoxin (DNA-binding transcriptional repressor) of toxin-antitoxin stability system
MFHGKTVTVRELREGSPDGEVRLKQGETLIVHKRKKVIGRIVPELHEPQTYPDFKEIQQEIFGNKTMKRTFTELIREERDRY